MHEIKVITPNRWNYGDKRSISNIKYIVIHYTGNDGDSDTANGNYFKNNIVNASAHYFVDDDSITQSVPDNYTAWSVGGKKYSDCDKTGGGQWCGKCTNANSISIELCDTVKNGISDFSGSTVKNAVELVRELMRNYNIDISHVIRHFDVTGKICPKPYIDSVKWQNFKNMIMEENEMTADEKKKFNELVGIISDLRIAIDKLGDRITALENPMIYNYIDENMPEWARPTIQKLVGKGALVGNEKGELGLSDSDLKQLVINDRVGLYG